MGPLKQELVRAGLVLAIACALALWLLDVVLSPASRELLVAGACLVSAGTFSVVASGLIARRASSHRLLVQIAAAAVVGIAGFLVALGLSAYLMFISAHDLELLFVLLGYSVAVAAVPAAIVAREVGSRLRALGEAAERMGAGDLSVRVPASGRDEASTLARAFNQMAEALGDAERERKSLERARSELFANISHDLRTPVSAIRVMADAIHDGVIEDEATRARYIATIRTETLRLGTLIDDLFELAMIDSGALPLRMEVFRVEDLIREAIQLVSSEADQQGVALEFVPEGALAAVRADPQRLGRVLRNLLTNALRHTPSDGTIQLRARASAETVTLVVADTGEGIADEDLPFVFERLYRGEKSRRRDSGGSGLGLSIARGIVEAHGGRIWVEPHSGPGARIAFTVPAARA